MKDLYLYSFDEEEKKDMVFWSGGNFPTQVSLGASFDDIRMWFKALFLLSRKIIASSSFYYESEITRKITEEFNEIFRTENALYFIDENISNFSEHGLLKIEKSPKTLSAYSDIEQVKMYGVTLDMLGIALKRPPDSIGKKIQYMWVKDVFSQDSKSLGMFLRRSMRINSNREEASLQLSGIATNPHVDFVWEYIVSEASKFTIKLPNGFDTFARKRLSEIYTLACADILDLQLDLNLMDRVSRFDTKLFCQCMNYTGVLSALKKLNSKELISLKQRDEFSWFQEQYFKLIKAVNNNEEKLKESFKHADKIRLSPIQQFLFQQEFLTGVGVRDIIRLYFKGKKNIKEYEKPVDFLLSAYDVIANDVDKQNLIEWLDELSNLGTVRTYTTLGQLQGGINEMDTNVVIATALREEFEAVLRHLRSSGTVDSKTYPHTFGLESNHGFPIRGVLLETGKGQVKAALEVLSALMKYSPDILMLTGITGGIKGAEDLNLCDIIVGEQHVYYEYSKIVQSNPSQVRFQVTRGGKNLLTTARNLPRKNWLENSTFPLSEQSPHVYYGVVLTGDKVVADTDFITELQTSWSRALGVEMESYGASMAVEYSNPRADFLMVKAISDMADKDKDDSVRDYCTDIAAAYTVALIKNHNYRNRQTTNGMKTIPGKVLLELNERLFVDWERIATYLDIPKTHCARFKAGHEIIEIYEWLKSRNCVSKLYDAIIGIDRKDVLES